MLKPFSHKHIKLLKSSGLGAHEIKHYFETEMDEAIETALAQGLRLNKNNGFYTFNTTHQAIEDTVFCIVDIETNGSKIEKHQIIEIGAVKVQNMAIIDTFESLVQCDSISEHITEITAISAEDTKHAPSLDKVLEEFKHFIGDAVFVAHAVKFDYSFISKSLQKVGYMELLNRHLCTIELAERTISSYRYGLSYLNEELELYKEATHHRALSDAITTAKLFKHTLKALPKKIKTAEELISFSKEGKRLKRPKFDPQLLRKEAEEEEEKKEKE